MTWWCSASSGAWDWKWDPYPGVWLLVAALLFVYWLAVRRSGNDPTNAPPPRGQVLRFIGGAVVLWLAADWPLGPLGAGYLVSVHMVQYLLYSMVVPPLLLSGIPVFVLRRAIRSTGAMWIARFLSKPLIAFLIFNVVMLASHLPSVLDGLAATQFGSFGMDMAWLFAGFVFWWQVLGPLPELNPLSDQQHLHSHRAGVLPHVRGLPAVRRVRALSAHRENHGRSRPADRWAPDEDCRWVYHLWDGVGVVLQVVSS
jgi:cytochrome c oxidase assembly factor CtaG